MLHGIRQSEILCGKAVADAEADQFFRGPKRSQYNRVP